MKYGEVTMGQVEAVINKMGGIEAWNAFLNGDKKFIIENAIKKLFDKNGRRIPIGFKASVCDPNRNLKVSQPKMNTVEDYANVLDTLATSLGIFMKDLGITAEEFMAKTEELKRAIPEDSRNILNGTCLPLVLPKHERGDVGTFIQKLLEGLSVSYKGNFPDRSFNNYLRDRLTGNVSVIHHTQDELLCKMKDGPVVVLFFPTALQGFSVCASREQIDSLPAGFVLSGIEAIIADICYDKYLAESYSNPGLDLAAFNYVSSDHSLCLKAFANKIGFDHTAGLDNTDDSYSSGLSFVK